MARRSKRRVARDGASDGLQVALTYKGRLTERGELPASELAQALQGWDRLLQIGYYSYHMNALSLPERGTNVRVEFHIRRIGKGSFLIDAMLWMANAVGEHIVGGGSVAGFLWLTHTLVRRHVKAKAKQRTLDGAVDAAENVAKKERLRISNDREDSEDYVAALDSAITNATAPLDSSAASAMLSVKGQEVVIEFDHDDRQVIRVPFDPPSVDPDAEALIVAPVRFVRINKKTGIGLMTFVRPKDESQLGQQRFHCEDKSIRRRANQYTGAFHLDEPMTVLMQRKAYEKNRRGHYWLIVAPAKPTDAEETLFTAHTPAKRSKKRQRK